jgi:hypothetical protein
MIVYEVRNKATREIENTLGTREEAVAFAAKMAGYGVPCFVVAMIYNREA